MEMHELFDEETGRKILVYPRPWFMREVAGYCHDKTYRQFLNNCWSMGESPEQAIAAIREKLDALTKVERREAWQRQLAAWREAREARARRGPGRPSAEVSLGGFRAEVAAALCRVISRFETKHLSVEAKQALDNLKRQVLGT